MKSIHNYFARVALALASFACIVTSDAQVINPSQPATGVPTAGPGISVAGQQVSINYGLGSQTYTGTLNAANFGATTSITTAALTATGTVSGAGFDNYIGLRPIVQTVANVAALRTINCNPGSLYADQGYTSLADGGQAMFVCNGADTTTPDNGGSIIAANNTFRLYMLFNGQPVSVKTFGAKCDNSTSDSTTIQNALTALGGKQDILIPASSACIVTTPLSVAIDGTRIVGLGEFVSVLKTVSTTTGIISIATPGQVFITGINFTGPASGGTAGNLVNITGTAGSNAYTTIRDSLFQGGWNQIGTTSALLFDIDHNVFSNWVNAAVTVQNTFQADGGDSQIHGNTFSNAPSALACIRFLSSGGLRVTNNKMNTAQYSFLLQISGTTSDLLVGQNSMENASIAAMAFSFVSGSFNNIDIVGNQIALTPNGILMNDTNLFFNTGSIAGNVITVTGSGIQIDNASALAVTGNSIQGSGSPTIGLKIGANVTGGEYWSNWIKGFPTARVQNLSTSGVSAVHDYILGSFFSGAPAPINTSENIMSTVNVPPLDITSSIRDTTSWITSGTGNSKTLRVRLGGIAGTVLWSDTTTTTTQTDVTIEFGNTGVTNQQVVTVTEFRNGVAVSTTPITIAVATNVVTQLVATEQKTTAGDNVVLSKHLVELFN